MRIIILGGNSGIAQGIYSKLNEKYGNYPNLIFTIPRHIIDITKEDQVKDGLERLRPDVLINCAGYIVPNKIKDTSLEEWNNHININLTGFFLASKYAILNECETIINIGSTSAFEARDSWSSYCCGKVGALALIEGLAKEGVKAYSIHPARTVSKMRERLFPNEDKTTLMNPERIGEFVIRILNGEFANGSSIVVKKDEYYVLPMRKGI